MSIGRQVRRENGHERRERKDKLEPMRMSGNPHQCLTNSKPQTLMLLVTFSLYRGIKLTLSPRVRHAKEHLVGARSCSLAPSPRLSKLTSQ